MADQDIVPLRGLRTAGQQARAHRRDTGGSHCLDKISPSYALLRDLFFPHVFTSNEFAEYVSWSAIRRLLGEIAHMTIRALPSLKWSSP